VIGVVGDMAIFRQLTKALRVIPVDYSENAANE
jgi:hypothetical protein